MRMIAVLVVLGLATGVAAQEPTPAGAVFRDCTDCPDMVVIPGGEAEIGATAADIAMVPAEIAAMEQPRHRVRVRTFALGRTTVTRAQFSAFVFETGYRITAPCGAYDLATKTFVRPPGTSWLEPGFVQSDRDPVVCVSYDDAQAYIRWLTRKTKRLYRLPSEAEWEYAARAGTQTVRPWGEANICRHANVADRSAVAAGLEDTSATAFACSDGFTFTAPVASFAPNAFGLHDMLGNTAQWMADCLSPTYDGAPADAMPRAGAEDCRRVLRGGAWMTPPESIRSARRSSDPRDGRGNGLSFRVARDLEPPADQAQDR